MVNKITTQHEQQSDHGVHHHHGDHCLLFSQS